MFCSTISQKIVRSSVQVKPNEWFHIVLVQTRNSEDESPEQKLWINGKLEVTTEVPRAAYDSCAKLSLRTKQEFVMKLADFSIWSRCLLPIEIRSIYQQKTSIDNADIAKYIFENQI